MTVDRLARVGIFIALLTLGAVVISLFAALQQIINFFTKDIVHFFGLIIVLGLSIGMVWIMAKVALTSERRTTGWVRSLAGPNGKYLFLVLIILWTIGMAALASLGLTHLEAGGIALIMLFLGFFLFMGFIWAVIGE